MQGNPNTKEFYINLPLLVPCALLCGLSCTCRGRGRGGGGGATNSKFPDSKLSPPTHPKRPKLGLLPSRGNTGALSSARTSPIPARRFSSLLVLPIRPALSSLTTSPLTGGSSSRHIFSIFSTFARSRSASRLAPAVGFFWAFDFGTLDLEAEGAAP